MMLLDRNAVAAPFELTAMPPAGHSDVGPVDLAVPTGPGGHSTRRPFVPAHIAAAGHSAGRPFELRQS